MAFSQKDEAFFREVVKYYQGTISENRSEGSIRETARHFKIARTKVKKILITKGVYHNPLAQRIAMLRYCGLSIEEIASETGMAASTVSTYLPYEDKIDHSLDPSPHAKAVREYRAYEKQQAERKNLHTESLVDDTDVCFSKKMENEAKMSQCENFHRPHRETWADAEEESKQLEKLFGDEEWEQFDELSALMKSDQEEQKRDLEELEALGSLSAKSVEDQKRLTELQQKHGLFPGALSSRNTDVLSKLYGERLPFTPWGVLRLHLELCASSDTHTAIDIDEGSSSILCQYGDVKHGRSISRDIVVPEDMPLYALHFVIQRLFGWRNQQRHQYFIPLERTRMLCHDNASMWSCMVGLVFRSPLMSALNENWMNDYTGGGYKYWFRKKYTGPYLSQNRSEGLIPCQEQMTELNMVEKFLICYATDDNGKEFISRVCPETQIVEEGYSLPTQPDGKPYKRIKTVRFEELSVDELCSYYKNDPISLIERLPISSVIASGNLHLSDQLTPAEWEESAICDTGEQMFTFASKYIHNVIEAYEDTPERQVCPLPFTDVLFYHYGNWTLRITASNNCQDLMDRMTQDDLDLANLQCRSTYRPVLIAKDGLPVFDIEGGLQEYCRFLLSIHPDLDSMIQEDRTAAKRQCHDQLKRAKKCGWQCNESSNFNFL